MDASKTKRCEKSDVLFLFGLKDNNILTKYHKNVIVDCHLMSFLKEGLECFSRYLTHFLLNSAGISHFTTFLNGQDIDKKYIIELTEYVLGNDTCQKDTNNSQQIPAGHGQAETENQSSPQHIPNNTNGDAPSASRTAAIIQTDVAMLIKATAFEDKSLSGRAVEQGLSKPAGPDDVIVSDMGGDDLHSGVAPSRDQDATGTCFSIPEKAADLNGITAGSITDVRTAPIDPALLPNLHDNNNLSESTHNTEESPIGRIVHKSDQTRHQAETLGQEAGKVCHAEGSEDDSENETTKDLEHTCVSTSNRPGNRKRSQKTTTPGNICLQTLQDDDYLQKRFTNITTNSSVMPIGHSERENHHRLVILSLIKDKRGARVDCVDNYETQSVSKVPTIGKLNHTVYVLLWDKAKTQTPAPSYLKKVDRSKASYRRAMAVFGEGRRKRGQLDSTLDSDVDSFLLKDANTDFVRRIPMSTVVEAHPLRLGDMAHGPLSELWRFGSFGYLGPLSFYAIRLSENGLFYDRGGNTVRCFSCGARDSNLDLLEAGNLGRFHLPNCPHAHSRDTRNVPIGTSDAQPAASNERRLDEVDVEHDGEAQQGSVLLTVGQVSPSREPTLPAVSSSSGRSDPPKTGSFETGNLSLPTPAEDPGLVARHREFAAQSAGTAVPVSSISPYMRDSAGTFSNEIVDGVNPASSTYLKQSATVRYVTCTTSQVPTVMGTGRDHEYSRYSVQATQSQSSAVQTYGQPNTGPTSERRPSSPPLHEELGEEGRRVDAVLIQLDMTRAASRVNATARDRLVSFFGWLTSSGQTPRTLALAGFYYLGSGDSVRCWYCGIILRNWRPFDDPWVTHVLFRFSCDFVTAVRGQNFVTQALVSRGHGNASLSLAEFTPSSGSIDGLGAIQSAAILQDQVRSARSWEESGSPTSTFGSQIGSRQPASDNTINASTNASNTSSNNASNTSSNNANNTSSNNASYTSSNNARNTSSNNASYTSSNIASNTSSNNASNTNSNRAVSSSVGSNNDISRSSDCIQGPLSEKKASRQSPSGSTADRQQGTAQGLEAVATSSSKVEESESTTSHEEGIASKRENPPEVPGTDSGGAHNTSTYSETAFREDGSGESGREASAQQDARNSRGRDHGNDVGKDTSLPKGPDDQSNVGAATETSSHSGQFPTGTSSSSVAAPSRDNSPRRPDSAYGKSRGKLFSRWRKGKSKSHNKVVQQAASTAEDNSQPNHSSSQIHEGRVGPGEQHLTQSTQSRGPGGTDSSGKTVGVNNKEQERKQSKEKTNTTSHAENEPSVNAQTGIIISHMETASSDRQTVSAHTESSNSHLTNASCEMQAANHQPESRASHVERVPRERRTTGQLGNHGSQMLQVDSEAHDSVQGTSSKECTLSRGPDITSSATETRETSQRQSSTVPEPSGCRPVSEPPLLHNMDPAERDALYRRLQEENQRLRARRTCRICRRQTVDTIFLPCGHICSCETCASTVRECCLCFQRIRGTAHVYLE